MTKEELKQQLLYTIERYCNQSSSESHELAAEYCLEHIEDFTQQVAKEAAEDGWVSVKDRLPEGECLSVGYQNEILIGYIGTDRVGGQTFGTGFLCSNDHETLTHVTHWQTLPKPPNP